MLYFIGLGLNKEQLSLEAVNTLKSCNKIYLEAYTSNYTENNINALEKQLNIKFIKLYREDVEQGFSKIILEAKEKDICFCVFGNITSATTHASIINEAKEAKVKIKQIPGISIFSVIPMLTGLEEYRFGRTVSIVKPLDNYKPKSFFEYILQNKKIGLHTICLLDIKIEKNKKYYMQPYEATLRLLEIAKEKNIETKDWQIYVISGACSKKENVFISNLKEISQMKTNYDYPTSLVITGKLTYDEKENQKHILK